MPFEFDPTVSALETKYNIPVGLYKNLLLKGERSGQTAVSPRGAIGFAQLMPGTARDMNVDPWDPEQNLEGGAKYFRAMLDEFKTPELALAAYNAGPGNVRKAGGVPNFPETQAYVKRVLGMSVAPDTAPARPDANALAGGLSSQDQALMDQAKAGLAHSNEVGADVEKQLAETRARMKAIADEPIPERPKPPTILGLPDAPNKDEYIKDPMRVLGQTLPLIAILGSLGTRNGAVNAMRSASAALNAARANDKDAFATARQEWKDHMEQIISTNDQERARYMDILEDRKLSMQDKIANLQVQTALDGNSQMQAMVANGQLGELYKFLQMRDAATYRAAQVYDMADRRENDRKRLKIEEDKLDELTKYRQRQAELAQARLSKEGVGELAARLREQKRVALNNNTPGGWTAVDEEALSNAEADYQRSNWAAQGGSAAPVVAPGAAMPKPGAEIALPKPKSEADAIDGKLYMTSRGPMRWNAAKKGFVAP